MKLPLALALFIGGPSSWAHAQSSIINVGVKSAKVPKNPRADRDAIIHVGGTLDQTCYSLHGVRVDNPSPGQHRIVVEAKINGTNCKTSKKAFNETINLGLLPAGQHFLTFTRQDGTDKSTPFIVKPGRELKVEQPSGDIFADKPKDSALPTEKYQEPHTIETNEGPTVRHQIPAAVETEAPLAREAAAPMARETSAPLSVQPSTPVDPVAPIEDAAVLPFNADDLPSGE